MKEASRVILTFLLLIVLIHAVQGYKAGLGFSQAWRWIRLVITGNDPNNPSSTGTGAPSILDGNPTPQQLKQGAQPGQVGSGTPSTTPKLPNPTSQELDGQK